MSKRQIPNLTPVVTISPTAQLEIVQAGTTYRTTAWNIAALNSLSLINNTTENSSWFPLFSSQINTTLGPNPVLYTSDNKYNYKPSEGRLTAQRVEASQGLFLNASMITLDYIIPTNDNAMSMGPVTASSIITIQTGSVWGVL
jgi:hypothetical protein